MNIYDAMMNIQQTEWPIKLRDNNTMINIQQIERSVKSRQI